MKTSASFSGTLNAASFSDAGDVTATVLPDGKIKLDTNSTGVIENPEAIPNVPGAIVTKAALDAAIATLRAELQA